MKQVYAILTITFMLLSNYSLAVSNTGLVENEKNNNDMNFESVSKLSSTNQHISKDRNTLKEQDLNRGFNNNYEDNTTRFSLNPQKAALESNTNIENATSVFNPQINVRGRYIEDNITGKIGQNNTNILLRNQGNYTVFGNIADLGIQYFANPGAESASEIIGDGTDPDGDFYRQRYNNSLEGDYSWKYYKQINEGSTSAHYQKEIDIYENDALELSYNLLFQSNSTLHELINSSIIFSFEFNTFHLVIYNWYYTNVEPKIGENSTSMPIAQAFLLKNISWDNQWHPVRVNISELVETLGFEHPINFVSLTIFFSSPSPSNVSFLIDNLQLISKTSPDRVNLKINNTLVNTTLDNWNFFLNIDKTNDTLTKYDFIWYYNSSYYLVGNYQITLIGNISLSDNRTLSLKYPDIKYKVVIENITSNVKFIEIEYPTSWIFDNNSDKYDIISIRYQNNSIITTIDISITAITQLTLYFMIPNLIKDIELEDTIEVFDRINLNISTTNLDGFLTLIGYNYSSDEFFFPIETSSNKIEYVFPNYLPRGLYNTTILFINNVMIGYRTFYVKLIRFPAQLQTEDSFSIPQYSVRYMEIYYQSLDNQEDIINASIKCTLEDNNLDVQYVNGTFLVMISAYYLELGTYNLYIVAQSETHATVKKTVVILVIEGIINVSLDYTYNDNYESCIVLFNITSSKYPVSFAPLYVKFNQTTVYGASNVEGMYNTSFPISPVVNYIFIEIGIIKITTIIFNKTFTIEFNKVQAYLIKSDSDIILDKNITLEYNIQYPTESTEWFSKIDEEMFPIIEAYIETDTYRYPVFLDGEYIYWRVFATPQTSNHKMIIITSGVLLSTSLNKESKDIIIEFTITSETKTLSKVSVLFYFNDTVNAKEYAWKLTTINDVDLTKICMLVVNDLYAYFTNINITKGSYLLLKLTGHYSITMLQYRSLIPVVIGTTSIITAVIVGWKIYNKRKSLILTI